MKRNGDDFETVDRTDRRLRRRRRRRRAYIRSMYSLPTLATLGNAICGFGAMYVASMPFDKVSRVPGAEYFASDPFLIAAYLIFLAMLFDALDGRLARFTRHTTDFGGQLDSLADAISFGAAPAFLALQLFKQEGPYLPNMLARAVWAIGALYVACALLRLARFNVSNQHGEQHHFSFLGLPSPAAAALIASYVLMQRELRLSYFEFKYWFFDIGAYLCAIILPLLTLIGGLLMVSTVRYPHLVNRFLRGRRSVARIIFVLVIAFAIVIAHRYTIALGVTIYVIFGLVSSERHLRRAKEAHV